MRTSVLCLLVSLCAALASADGPLWLRYPALSPDGSTIVFSYQGNLFSVPATGGTAVQLTSHPAHDSYPVWSKDGSRIAFASDRHGNFDVFVMPASGGAAERLTYHSNDDYPYAFDKDDATVLFSSYRIDDPTNAQFPSGSQQELYSIPATGGRVHQVLTLPAEDVSVQGDVLYYHDRKGYEDPWRKHHMSSIARDVWSYDRKSGAFTKLTDFAGEDRDPVPVNGRVFYLSERSGSFNVWSMNADGSDQQQATQFTTHPVRFLTASASGTLCFTWDGRIYTKGSGEPVPVSVQVASDISINRRSNETYTDKATEIAVSPNGKELAFVVRGEVYVVSTANDVTKQITNTPEQERTVSFSPDGRSILYAGERNGSWNLYQTSLTRKEEKYFHLATVLKEEAILATEKEEFQPAYSPDGKEVAFLEERTTLRVLNLASKEVRTVLPGEYNYSYADGDMSYEWSPDGKWFVVSYNANETWPEKDLGFIAADGKSPIVNLTQSGYSEFWGSWWMDGNVILYGGDRYGRRSHASWGADADVFAIFMNQKTMDAFELTEAERAVVEEAEKDKKKDDKKDDEKKDEDKKDEKLKPITIELDGILDRVKRLTINSSQLRGAVLTPKGEKLYYLARFEKGYDLWVNDLVKGETKLLQKLGPGTGALIMDAKGENLYVIDGGRISKIGVKGDGAKKEGIGFRAEFTYRPYEERAYMFEHAWRQIYKKFYDPGMHGVDWEMYKKEYMKFLPYVTDGYDFADMLGEMLGELNGSHTGGRYGSSEPNGDRTAALGAYIDWSYTGPGLKVAEILPGSPLIEEGSKIKPGVIIEKIGGDVIGANDNVNLSLNRLTDKPVLLSLYDPDSKDRWDETVKPISLGEENQLRYKRWVRRNQEFTESYSKGKVGYVHVRGMNDASYRDVFNDLLGKLNTKEAVVVDTRFNGGGWLHDDLAVLLSGRKYMTFSPRGQENLGHEPIWRWTKPSVVIMGEGNYSDAHMFPYTYKALGIGKLVGMPVPGTGTAVWWEQMIDGETVFGIPQVGMKGNDGKYLENQQLEPDIKVMNEPAKMITGEDQQLKRAIEEMLDEIGDER